MLNILRWSKHSLNHLIQHVSACIWMRTRSGDYLLSNAFAAIHKYLEIDLINSKGTNGETEKIFSLFRASDRVWTQDLLVLSLLPCHLSHHTSSSEMIYCTFCVWLCLYKKMLQLRCKIITKFCRRAIPLVSFIKEFSLE